MQGKNRHLAFVLALDTQSLEPVVSPGTSLAPQWPGLCTSAAEDGGFVPGQDTKILYPAQSVPNNQINNTLSSVK